MKITKNLIKKIEKDAKEYFIGASGCHDWTHIERVRILALKIGKKEKADLGILELAVMLHDICRKEEMASRGKICHAERGSELARKILNKYKIGEEEIKNIADSIKSHRYRNDHQPKTIEAKVLCDADKLDALGAVGMSRIFLFAGHSGSKILYHGKEKELAKRKKNYSYSDKDSSFLEYEIKLKYLKDKMLTKEGRRIAKERSEYMKKFIWRFWQEVNGVK